MAKHRCLAKVVYEAPGAGDGEGDMYQTTIRCNGRLFNINMATTFIHDSPAILARLQRFLLTQGEFVYGEEPATEDGPSAEEERNAFHQWLITTFRPVFRAYAPDVLPSFDPDAIRSGTARPVLTEYMFPQVFECRLEAQRGKARPRCIGKQADWIPSVNRIPADLLADLDRLRVPRYAPSEIAVAFENPDDAMREMPNRVLVDLNHSGHPDTACHLKLFLGGCEGELVAEVRSHVRVLEAQLGAHVRVIRLVGIVWLDEYADAADFDKDGNAVPYPECLLGPVGGLLLTYVSDGWEGLLTSRVWSGTPAMRRQWADQVRETVTSLHKAGVVWGDAKPDNVMVDGSDNAWLIDLGGGFTEGWVDKEKAGTKEGDLQGVAKIEEYLMDDARFEMSSEDEQEDEHEGKREESEDEGESG
ncbi:hypothetical protein SPBR_07368 [Sporothrix brasiliensis 5110]|uniref:Protein kinase domain-containing protein n=1 Tax=Sporothrix brasiliensis 5110 TaxID=1398154 RepID=A0A0C2IHR2_9PEZI|nr:uncharacterized protein SPBR_07368 [Sporothrix brasiliensis 5110]KIH88701.1 hypothetical protein SPBR_07368 [Sporothrix brasiliensis 5110]